jgi:hypothetical protein
LPDVTPPSQVHDGPVGTKTPTSFFKRLLGPTQTIEPTGPALTLRYALPSDIGELVALLVDRAHQLRRVQRGRNHLLPRVWPGTGYDRPATG